MQIPTGPGKISNLAAHVRARLERLLDAPEWRQGGRLPPEDALAQQLEVSRPTLRKALAELRAEGRIVSLRGSGNFVQPTAGLSDDPVSRENLTIRTAFDMKRCLTFRMKLECAAAEEAAIQRDRIAIEHLVAASEQLATAQPGPSIFSADFAFHLALARATLNPYFPFVLETLRDQIRLTMEFGRQLRGRPLDAIEHTVVREHQRIIDAVAKGDPAEARAAMAAHMGKTLDRIPTD